MTSIRVAEGWPSRRVASLALIALVSLAVPVCSAGTPRPGRAHAAPERPAPPATEPTAYSFSLPGSDGKDIPLSTFRGRYLLLVNLARESTYSAQLQPLVAISETYKARGLTVVGVPSNDFGASEPGTDGEIQKYYAGAKVPFIVSAPAKLSGDDALPLYGFLTKAQGKAPADPVHWNYTKFIIGPDGKLIARLDPDVAPDSAEMKATLEQILEHRYKPTDAAHPPVDVASQ